MNIIAAIKHFDSSLRIENDINPEIYHLGTLKEEAEGTLSYLYDLKYKSSLINNKGVKACIVTQEVFDAIKAEKTDCTYIISNDPSCDFFLFHNYLFANTDFYGDKKPSIIDASAIIGPGVQIAPHNVIIGENVEIGANAVILEGTILDDNVQIGPNTTIGIEGTQISLDKSGKKFRVQHAGGVHIGSDTFVGANAVIVKSLFKEKTLIGKNCTIGNLVNMGHNTKTGNEVLVLANSVICGSTIIKDRARVSPGSFVASSLLIEEDAFITLGAVVSRNVDKGQRVSGNFAINHRKFLAHIKNIAQ
jgi:UDP-3-O-[3-hydroxymyristoyl] glucosamine N-acyltransferase